MLIKDAMMTLWQLTITSEMIGLEANIAVEVIVMIANIQTLGVPIRYASLPGTVAAAAGVFLIPFLGFVLDRWAKSKLSKANILAFTTMIQLTGSLMVLLANALKLGLYTAGTRNDFNESNNGNLTGFLHFQDADDTSNDTIFSTNLTAGVNNTSEVFDYIVLNLQRSSQNNTIIPHSWQQVLNTSFPIPESSIFSRTDSSLSSRINRPVGPSYTSAVTAKPVLAALPEQPDVPQEPSSVEEIIPFYAYIAMVGYTMCDCGYDSSNCFLKTFVLHCTPSEYHVSIIVKSILVSSLGGVLISVLGSFELGPILTAGTGYDSSSALVCLIASLSNTLLIIGTLATFITGFCWRPPFYRREEDSEKTQLVNSASQNGKIKRKHSRTTSQGPNSALEQSYSCSRIVASTSMTEREPVVDDVRLDVSDRSGILGFIQRQKKQILVNATAFCLLSSLYSFEVFVVNFLGSRVFQGDPGADNTSEAYQRYQKGVAVGSQGTLIYYITFAISSFFHEKILSALGWKKEMLITSLIYGALCVASAITEELWLFYIVAIWTGVFRAVSVAVPYILANQISAEQNGGKSSGTAIAIVAAMLPCGFLVCSTLMGPLIDATGNAAVSMYYSGIFALLGCISIILLKI